MLTTLTSEENRLLNLLLKNIPFNKIFKLEDVHANILKPNSKTANAIYDLENYDALKYWIDNNFYTHIGKYLIERGFIINVGSFLYELTLLGQVLCSYGEMEDFFKDRKRNTEEIEVHVSDIIAQAPLYSEFKMKHEISDPKIFDALNPKQRIIHIYEQGIKDEEVMQYLVNEGFAVNRLDIKTDDFIYRQLTDRGRELKECGSIEAFRNWERNEKEKEAIRQAESDELRRANIITGKIQSSLLSINRWIALSTAVAAFCSLCLLVNEILKSFHWVGTIQFWTTVSVLFCGMILGIILYKLISKQKSE